MIEDGPKSNITPVVFENEDIKYRLPNVHESSVNKLQTEDRTSRNNAMKKSYLQNRTISPELEQRKIGAIQNQQVLYQDEPLTNFAEKFKRKKMSVP